MPRRALPQATNSPATISHLTACVTSALALPSSESTLSGASSAATLAVAVSARACPSAMGSGKPPWAPAARGCYVLVQGNGLSRRASRRETSTCDVAMPTVSLAVRPLTV